MAKANKHTMGPGSQGKGSGSGAMTDLPEGILEENMVLSNRDKSRHSDERGLDSKTVQTEQYQDHAANRETDIEDLGGSTSGLSGPMTNTSGADSALARREHD
jgi:hypothetical protein